MKFWLTHNLGLKIISVILAVVVWWLIKAKIEVFPDMPPESGTNAWKLTR